MRLAIGVRALVAALLLAGRACAQAPAPALPPDAGGADVLAAWAELQLDMMRETPGFSPPVAARAMAYTGVASWEALVPAWPDRSSLVGRLNGLTAMPRPAAPYLGEVAANHALASVLRGLYPTAFADYLAAVDELERRIDARFSPGVDGATLARSQRFGDEVGAAVLAWSEGDGGAEGYLGGTRGFVPDTGPGAWVPTPRNNGPPLPPLQPTWGSNRPLILPSGEACPAPPPPTYSEAPGSVFYAQARDVYDTVRGLTPDQRAIALFWSDDPGQTSTPPGHWLAILTQTVRQSGASARIAAEAYARLGIAENDAFITCWVTKYRYQVIRPITYIQRLIDPSWDVGAITDPVITPPFPEYTSGHSLVSAAAAAVLTAEFGATPFVDRTHDRRGFAPRAYPSFEAAAAEAAISRLYGGIHYRVSIDRGVAQGLCVAQRVLALSFGP